MPFQPPTDIFNPVVAQQEYEAGNIQMVKPAKPKQPSQPSIPTIKLEGREILPGTVQGEVEIKAKGTKITDVPVKTYEQMFVEPKKKEITASLIQVQSAKEGTEFYIGDKKVSKQEAANILMSEGKKITTFSKELEKYKGGTVSTNEKGELKITMPKQLQPYEKEAEAFTGKEGKTKAASFGLKVASTMGYLGPVGGGIATILKPHLADDILKTGAKASAFIASASLSPFISPTKIAKATKSFEIKGSPTDFMATKLPKPVKGAVAELGVTSYVAGSDVLSFAAGAVALPNVVSNVVGKGNLYKTPKFLQRHYVSAFDVALEPIGLAPKGSSKAFRSLMKHYPAGTIAGTAAGEAAIWLGTAGAGKAIGKGIKSISTNVKAIRVGSRAARAEKALGFSKSWQKSMAKIARRQYIEEAKGVRTASKLVRRSPDYLYVPIESEAQLPEGITGKIVKRGGKKWIRYKYGTEGKIRYHISQKNLLEEWSKPRMREYRYSELPTKAVELEHTAVGSKFKIKANITPHKFMPWEKRMVTKTEFTGIKGKLFRRARATQFHYVETAVYEGGGIANPFTVETTGGGVGKGIYGGAKAGGTVVSEVGSGGGLVSKMMQRMGGTVKTALPKVIFDTESRALRSTSLALAGGISATARISKGAEESVAISIPKVKRMEISSMESKTVSTQIPFIKEMKSKRIKKSAIPTQSIESKGKSVEISGGSLASIQFTKSLPEKTKAKGNINTIASRAVDEISVTRHRGSKSIGNIAMMPEVEFLHKRVKPKGARATEIGQEVFVTPKHKGRSASGAMPSLMPELHVEPSSIKSRYLPDEILAVKGKTAKPFEVKGISEKSTQGRVTIPDTIYKPVSSTDIGIDIKPDFMQDTYFKQLQEQDVETPLKQIEDTEKPFDVRTPSPAFDATMRKVTIIRTKKEKKKTGKFSPFAVSEIYRERKFRVVSLFKESKRKKK